MHGVLEVKVINVRTMILVLICHYSKMDGKVVLGYIFFGTKR